MKVLWGLRQADTRLFSLFFSLCALGLGTLLVLGGPVFDAPQYRAVREIAPGFVWGVFFLIWGGIWFGSLLRGWYFGRLIGALIGTPTWAMMALTFLLSGSVLTGFVIYGLMSLFSGAIFVKLWRD